jgi:hypothetical protein
LNSLETLATETGAAIAFGAHFAKGNASGRRRLTGLAAVEFLPAILTHF